MMELRKIPDRIVLYPRDIVNITGRNIRTAQRIIKKIRAANGKGNGGFITRKEFCQFCNLDEEDVMKYLRF
jgi:hypothetical protein